MLPIILFVHSWSFLRSSFRRFGSHPSSFQGQHRNEHVWVGSGTKLWRGLMLVAGAWEFVIQASSLPCGRADGCSLQCKALVQAPTPRFAISNTIKICSCVILARVGSKPLLSPLHAFLAEGMGMGGGMGGAALNGLLCLCMCHDHCVRRFAFNWSEVPQSTLSKTRSSLAALL